MFLLSKESQIRILNIFNELFDNPLLTDITIQNFTLESLKTNLVDENLPENVLNWFLFAFCDKNGKIFVFYIKL